MPIKECQKDPFSKVFLSKYPGQQAFSPEAKATLEVIAEASKTETVQLEWGHGRLHRLVTSSQVQTHVPHMRYVNAQWVCQKHTKDLGFWRCQRAPRKRARPGGALRLQKGRKVRAKLLRGHGGAFRAFISLERRGQRGRVDFAEVAQRFREERQANSARYQQACRIGNLATKRRAEGQTSFGANPSLAES